MDKTLIKEICQAAECADRLGSEVIEDFDNRLERLAPADVDIARAHLGIARSSLTQAARQLEMTVKALTATDGAETHSEPVQRRD